MKSRILLAIGAMGFSLGIGAMPAYAQATRTWVSGVGDDANPCSRTAPCKTFQGAISKTAAGGEINCLDPGGFGAVTITKSLTIVCEVEAGVLVSGTNGIIINAGASDVVILDGLDLEGLGTGLDGIRFLAGGALHVRNTTISDFRGSNSHGIAFQPSGPAELFIDNVHASENGNGTGTTGGLLVQPTGTGGARATIINSDFSNNNGAGIRVDSAGDTGSGIAVDVNHTRVGGNTSGVVVNQPAGNTGVTLSLLKSIVFINGTALSISGGATQFAVGGSTITGNITEMSQTNGGALQSFGDNYRVNNIVPGTFGGAAIPKS
jgi:hypothetical protein